MKIEHFAFNVSEPVAMAEWYCKNMGMTVMRKQAKAPHTHFLVDSSGSVMIEIYNNPSDAVPAYAQMNPLLLHLAFVSAEPTVDKDRLIKAGAKVVDELRLDDGSHLFMLRDPWGLAIQLCKRGKPILK